MKAEQAELIASKIFECGDDPDSPCHRIQFMGGQWPNNETPQGGLNKAGLISFLEKLEINQPPGGDV